MKVQSNAYSHYNLTTNEIGALFEIQTVVMCCLSSLPRYFAPIFDVWNVLNTGERPLNVVLPSLD